MKVLSATLIAIVVLVGVGGLGIYIVYPMWGRRVVFSDDSTKTKYPEYGQMVTKTEAKILRLPKGEGFPILTYRECV